MKIGVLQASSQRDKNEILARCVRQAVQGQEAEVVNFGVFAGDGASYSYVQAACWASWLLASGAIDFAVTGCSSGQGMMLACNSFPGVLCGYVQNVSDAYLFGRINAGNAVSYPLGLNFGWAAERNLLPTLQALFTEPFGTGYPSGDAARKQRDTQLLHTVRRAGKRTWPELLPRLDAEFVKSTLAYAPVTDYVLRYGKDAKLAALLQKQRIE